MMIKEDIPLYKLDLEGNNPFNKVDHEYMYRREVKNNNIVIPPKAPFYQKSFKMFDKSGKLLVEGVDYEFYGIMGKLTQFTGKPVGLFVRLLKDELLEWYVDYQVVGNFNKITNEILNMLHSIYEDDRFVIYDNITNKPLWFVPEIHQHDLTYQIYGFTDLVRELGRIAHYEATADSAQDAMVEVLSDQLAVYIEGYKKILMDLLDSHIGNMNNAHGVDKKDIGLGLVDNIRVATLQETLDGLRDDLTITPYNAAQAAQAAAGRNQKLFPSGSLPILRYGSDTFIPPTIAGSFEGMGGLTRRVGAIIETDGTLLILQHRNNGKVSGLYFTRCTNWQSQEAYYDFTAYTYQHPTATAAGANLDTIINGSNKYIMVVGDSKKNLWWWCETKGTFNPDRHILIPFTGEWVTEDMTANADIFVEYPWDRATLLADEKYKEHFCIYQAYPLELFQQKDPTYLAGIPKLGLYLNLRCAAYSFNVISGASNVIKRANVDYEHPIFGKRNDKYFIPWQPQLLKVSDGSYVVTAAAAVYDPPVKNVWMFRSTQGLWMSTGNPGEFGFRFEIVNAVVPNNAPDFNTSIAFRAILNVTKVGEDTRIKITPSAGSDKLYTIDPSKIIDGVKQWADYSKDVVVRLTPNSLDQVGGVKIAPGVMSFSGGVINQSFPPSYSIINYQYAENWQKLITPPPDLIGGYNQYADGDKIFTELNPIGLGTLFNSQTMFVADTDDYQTGGIMAKQIVGDESKWIFRTLGNLDANYVQQPPSQSGNYQGVGFINYPFKPEAYETNLGPQVIMSTMYPVAGRNNKDSYRFCMGASSSTTMMGNPFPKSNPVGSPPGDNLWMQEIKSKIVDGKMIITPVKVINLKDSLAKALAVPLTPLGITEADCAKTWSLTRVMGPDGRITNLAMVWAPAMPDTLVGFALVDIIETGTPDTSNGYPIYPSCTVLIRGGNGIHRIQNSLINPEPIYPDLSNSPTSGGFGFSFPFMGRDSNGTPDTSSFFAMASMSSQCRVAGGAGAPALMFEITPDGRSLLRPAEFQNQSWGPDSSIVPVPYYGIGQAGFGINIFEGAAVGARAFSHTGSIKDNIRGSIYAGTPIIGMSNILTPQFTVYFQKINNVILSGKMYDIPATYINIMDQDPNPANKVFYIYLYYDNGRANYSISQTVRSESSSQSLIATVYCGPTQIDRIIPYNRFSVDGASVSAKRQGSSILATSGSVFEIGNATPIMLDSDFIPE